MDRIDKIVNAIGEHFRTFGGGGEVSSNNPISLALKDAPSQFAAGVDVKEVVWFIIVQLAHSSTSAEQLDMETE